MSLAIDPKKGTHFPGNIIVSSHALDRTVEHFGVNRAQAPAWVKERLRKAALIDGHNVEEDGRITRMFTYNRVVFIVDAMEPCVVTTYPQKAAHNSIKSPIERIIQRTIKAAQRKEATETKRINVAIAELNVQRANCELRRTKSESLKVIADMDAKIHAIDVEIAELREELADVRREKKSIMKSVAVYV